METKTFVLALFNLARSSAGNLQHDYQDSIGKYKFLISTNRTLKMHLKL